MAKSANTIAREQFGKRLALLRRQAGITVTSASHAANVHSGTWSHWELGNHKPGIDKAPAIARALNLPIAALYESPDGSTVIAEVRVSAETLERVKQGGATEADATADRIARALSPRILQAAVPAKPRTRIKPRSRTSEPFRMTAEVRRLRLQDRASASLRAQA